jgi:hypothetical protein
MSRPCGLGGTGARPGHALREELGTNSNVLCSFHVAAFGRLYSLGAQPVQRLLAGLMQCENCFGGIQWISDEREQYCSESAL